MIADGLISYETKVILSVICAGLWIFFRTSDCYNMIPRQQLFPVVFVMGWTYLNYHEPLFLPIGLSILIFYAYGEKLIQSSSQKLENKDKQQQIR